MNIALLQVMKMKSSATAETRQRAAEGYNSKMGSTAVSDSAAAAASDSFCRRCRPLAVAGRRSRRILRRQGPTEAAGRCRRRWVPVAEGSRRWRSPAVGGS